MKLNDIIIVTLTDFRRHFNFPAFWKARMSFIRDMAPDRVFYFNEDDKSNYITIVNWIKAEQTNKSTEETRIAGLKALSIFARCNVSEKDFKNAIGLLDYTADIIYVSNNSQLNLPGKNMTIEEISRYVNDTRQKERLHKIEIKGEGEVNRTATIFIDGKEVFRLKDGQCVYVTEIGGKFIRALPNRLSSGPYILSLENNPERFESTLLEEYYMMGCTEMRYEGITQISFNKEKKPIFSSGKYYTLYD